MHPIVPRLALFALGLAAWPTAVASAAVSLAAVNVRVGETVEATLASGRTFVGAVDARTDARHLWLEFGDASARLRRPIAWSQVESVKVARAAATPQPIAPCPPQSVPQSVPQAVRWSPASISNCLTPCFSPAPTERPVRSVAFDLVGSSFRRPSSRDSLTLRVVALDEFERATPVDGVVELELRAPRFRGIPSSPRTDLFVWERVGRWTIPIRAVDFTSDGVLVRAPLRAVSAGLDDWPQWEIGLRLIVPGQGTFDASR